MISDIL